MFRHLFHVTMLSLLVTVFLLSMPVRVSLAGKKDTSSTSGWSNWNKDDGSSDDSSIGHKKKKHKKKK